eukprot:403373314
MSEQFEVHLLNYNLWRRLTSKKERKSLLNEVDKKTEEKLQKFNSSLLSQINEQISQQISTILSKNTPNLMTSNINTQAQLLLNEQHTFGFMHNDTIVTQNSSGSGAGGIMNMQLAANDNQGLISGSALSAHFPENNHLSPQNPKTHKKQFSNFNKDKNGFLQIDTITLKPLKQDNLHNSMDSFRGKNILLEDMGNIQKDLIESVEAQFKEKLVKVEADLQDMQINFQKLEQSVEQIDQSCQKMQEYFQILDAESIKQKSESIFQKMMTEQNIELKTELFTRMNTIVQQFNSFTSHHRSIDHANDLQGYLHDQVNDTVTSDQNILSQKQTILPKELEQNNLSMNQGSIQNSIKNSRIGGFSQYKKQQQLSTFDNQSQNQEYSGNMVGSISLRDPKQKMDNSLIYHNFKQGRIPQQSQNIIQTGNYSSINQANIRNIGNSVDQKNLTSRQLKLKKSLDLNSSIVLTNNFTTRQKNNAGRFRNISYAKTLLDGIQDESHINKGSSDSITQSLDKFSFANLQSKTLHDKQQYLKSRNPLANQKNSLSLGKTRQQNYNQTTLKSNDKSLVMNKFFPDIKQQLNAQGIGIQIGPQYSHQFNTIITNQKNSNQNNTSIDEINRQNSNLTDGGQSANSNQQFSGIMKTQVNFISNQKKLREFRLMQQTARGPVNLSQNQISQNAGKIIGYNRKRKIDDLLNKTLTIDHNYSGENFSNLDSPNLQQKSTIMKIKQSNISLGKAINMNNAFGINYNSNTQ